VDSGGGCGASGGGTYMSQVWNAPPVGGGPGGAHVGGYAAAGVPGVMGPRGEPVTAMAPYNSVRTDEATAARMMSTSVPMDIFQQTLAKNTQPGSGIVQAQALMPAQACAPGNMPGFEANPSFSLGIGTGGCPGAVPGCAMPGGTPGNYPPGAVAAVGTANSRGAPGAPQRTEVRFVGPAGMKISWFAPTPDGRAGFTTQYLEAPGRYNFMQAAIYRLKLSDIPLRPGVELYPTLEVVPANQRASAFLAHSAVPVTFTEEDFEQVAAGNFVVKVIYLPDPQFQELAAAGTEEIISTRLEPGADPILEAQRRGSILLVIRMGNVDQEAPNTPPLDNPGANFPPQAMMPTMPPGMAGSMPPGMPGSMPPVGPTAPTGPGMTPGATGPTSPSMPAPGPSVPPYLRSGPGLPMPSDPHTPPATTPVTPPTGPAMPLPPGTSWRPANDSGTLPASLPPMPPSPAERAK